MKRITPYFLEEMDKKYETKEVTQAPVGILTGYFLDANKNSRMTAKLLQIRHEPSWIKGKIVCRLTQHVGKSSGPRTCLIGMKPCNQLSKEERVK